MVARACLRRRDRERSSGRAFRRTVVRLNARPLISPRRAAATRPRPTRAPSARAHPPGLPPRLRAAPAASRCRARRARLRRRCAALARRSRSSSSSATPAGAAECLLEGDCRPRLAPCRAPPARAPRWRSANISRSGATARADRQRHRAHVAKDGPRPREVSAFRIMTWTRARLPAGRALVGIASMQDERVVATALLGSEENLVGSAIS